MANARETICQRIRNLYETDNFADILFIVQRDGLREKIVGHKPLFAISSPVFERVVAGDLAQGNVIAIDDVEPDAFKTLKKFIYTEEVAFESVHHARRVYEVAARYALPQLLEAAKKYLLSNVKL